MSTYYGHVNAIQTLFSISLISITSIYPFRTLHSMASFDLVYASFSTFSFPHFCSRSQFVVPVRSLFRSSTFNIHQFSVVVVVFVVVIIVALAIIFAIEAVTVFLPAYFISSLFMSFSFDVVPPDRSPLQLFEFLFVLCPEKRKRIGIRKKSKFLLVQSTVSD